MLLDARRAATEYLASVDDVKDILQFLAAQRPPQLMSQAGLFEFSVERSGLAALFQPVPCLHMGSGTCGTRGRPSRPCDSNWPAGMVPRPGDRWESPPAKQSLRNQLKLKAVRSDSRVRSHNVGSLSHQR